MPASHATIHARFVPTTTSAQSAHLGSLWTITNASKIVLSRTIAPRHNTLNSKSVVQAVKYQHKVSARYARRIHSARMLSDFLTSNATMGSVGNVLIKTRQLNVPVDLYVMYKQWLATFWYRNVLSASQIMTAGINKGTNYTVTGLEVCVSKHAKAWLPQLSAISTLLRVGVIAKLITTTISTGSIMITMKLGCALRPGMVFNAETNQVTKAIETLTLQTEDAFTKAHWSALSNQMDRY